MAGIQSKHNGIELESRNRPDIGMSADAALTSGYATTRVHIPNSAPYLLLVCAIGVLAGDSKQLFRTTANPPSPPGYLRDRGVRRLRAVTANFALIDQKAAKAFRAADSAPVALQFFADVTLKVRWTAVRPTDDRRGIVWTGSVEGAPHGQAVLIVSGQALTGDITCGAGLSYQVRTTESGAIWVREVDQKAFPKELNPIP
jgi:hypothetical protein